MNRACFSLLATATLLLPLHVWAGDSKPAGPADKMTPQTRLQVIRDLTAERVFARIPFPMGERGLEIRNGKVTPDEQHVAQLVVEHGFAAKPGDRVIITNVDVKEKSIILEINGGSKKREKWYQHIELGAGGGATQPVGGAPKSLEAKGSTVTLAFDKYVPELSGDKVREMLAPVFDFKALTEAEAYEKTLPPKVQNAIKSHLILVGMDREMVVYSVGRPPKKIRDKDDNGADYEEWIYGTPPEEVQFVRFQGNVVSRLEIMKVSGEKIVRTEKEVDLQSQETELAAKKPVEKPANAPTLRRPGEEVENTGKTNSGPTPYPPAVDRTPNDAPGSPPPHWRIAGL